MGEAEPGTAGSIVHAPSALTTAEEAIVAAAVCKRDESAFAVQAQSRLARDDAAHSHSTRRRTVVVARVVAVFAGVEVEGLSWNDGKVGELDGSARSTAGRVRLAAERGALSTAGSAESEDVELNRCERGQVHPAYGEDVVGDHEGAADRMTASETVARP